VYSSLVAAAQPTVLGRGDAEAEALVDPEPGKVSAYPRVTGCHPEVSSQRKPQAAADYSSVQTSNQRNGLRKDTHSVPVQLLDIDQLPLAIRIQHSEVRARAEVLPGGPDDHGTRCPISADSLQGVGEFPNHLQREEVGRRPLEGDDSDMPCSTVDVDAVVAHAITTTGFTSSPDSARRTASLISSNGCSVTIFSSGRWPCACKSSRRGMNTDGTLSPSTMPTSLRPNRSVDTSSVLVARDGAAPTRPQVPPLRQRIHRHAKHLRHASRLDSELNASLRELADRPCGIRVRTQDQVTRAQLGCKFETLLNSVHRNDLRASRQFGRRDRAQADSTRTEHSDRRTRLGPEGIQHGSGASLDAASEWADKPQVHVGVDSNNAPVINHRVLGERGLPEEAGADLNIVLPDGVTPVRSRCCEVMCPEVRAVGRCAAEAVGALMTRGVGQHDAITHADVGDVPPDPLDDTRAFVAQNRRHGRGKPPVPNDQVGVANA